MKAVNAYLKVALQNGLAYFAQSVSCTSKNYYEIDHSKSELYSNCFTFKFNIKNTKKFIYTHFYVCFLYVYIALYIHINIHTHIYMVCICKYKEHVYMYVV